MLNFRFRTLRLCKSQSLKPENFDEGNGLAVAFGVAHKAVTDHKGTIYQAAYLLVDRKTGKGISITIWDSEEDAIANEGSGYYQEQVNKFKDFFTAPPVREGYEVTVQTQG